jgi:ribose 5-phosphate isomerase A
MDAASPDPAKRLAAERALTLVEPGMTLGLGTGSTAAIFVELLGARVAAGLAVRGVPTSERTRAQAAALGIPLVGFDQVDTLDLAVDGADEVDPALRLIKGGGGALLHEKVVAAAARRFVVIVDEAKRVATLGAFPLPVEVLRFGWERVQRALVARGARAERRARADGAPFVTDSGNYIVDARFGAIADPEGLAAWLDATVGVVEHGLFIGMTERVIVGGAAGVVELT